MAVQQSGNITPGHIAKWVTTDVIEDGGPIGSGQTFLGSFLSADFNTLSDQAILLPSTITAFMVTGIVVTNATLALNVAVGGFYPQTSKGGVALVANTQVYSSLATANNLLQCTLTAGASGTRYSRVNVPDWTLYLSLTTAQGLEAFADVYILGVALA